MGHPQLEIPTQIDNSTTNGNFINTVCQKRSKDTEMRFYWVQDKIKQDSFHVLWKAVTANVGYF